MTTITRPMPGRPEVGPWLRGNAEWEPPQTTIAWRAELDLDGFAALDLDDIEEWFDAHRILTHETLTVNTSDAASWLKDRWGRVPDARQRELDQRPVIVDRGGMQVISLGEVIARLKGKNDSANTFLRGAEIIVPASFGGIRRGIGLLDHEQPKLDKENEKKSPEEQKAILDAWQNAIDVADIAPGRLRQRVCETIVDGEKQVPRVIGGGEEFTPRTSLRVDLESDDDRTVRLISYVPRYERLESGSKKQSLEDHVCAVRRRADAIVAALKLQEADPVRQALELAADWHDHGKNREFFQRTVGGAPTNGQRPWPDTVMGKSGGVDRGKAPRGYRHEFGSLREFTDSKKGEVCDDVFDLAMHLIAAHHGRGRPHFPKGGFDPDCESRSDELHTESIQRFARLRHKYGWWGLAWLENLLRCADQLASAEASSADDDDELEAAE